MLCVLNILPWRRCAPLPYMLSGFSVLLLYTPMQLHVLIYEAGQLFGAFSENVCVCKELKWKPPHAIR